MNSAYIQSIIDDTIITVSIQFPEQYADDKPTYSGKEYTYKTRLKLEEGDQVIVKTPRGIQVAQVSEVHNTPRIESTAQHNFKWIMQKVDVEAYDNSEQEDSDFRDKIQEKIREKHRREARANLEELFGDLKTLEIK